MEFGTDEAVCVRIRTRNKEGFPGFLSAVKITKSTFGALFLHPSLPMRSAVRLAGQSPKDKNVQKLCREKEP